MCWKNTHWAGGEIQPLGVMVDKSMGASNGELFTGSVRGQLVAKLTVVWIKATPTLNNTVIQIIFN